MTDDKTKPAEDRKRIDVNEPCDVAFWARKFGVPREQLIAAVRRVGPVAENVAREPRK